MTFWRTVLISLLLTAFSKVIEAFIARQVEVTNCYGQEVRSKAPVVALKLVSGADNAPQPMLEKKKNFYGEILEQKETLYREMLVEKGKLYEEMIEQKDKELNRTLEGFNRTLVVLLEQKEKDFQRRLEDKDKELSRTLEGFNVTFKRLLVIEEEKFQIFREERNARMMELEVKVLGAEGLLNCRGILEWAAIKVATENCTKVTRSNMRYTQILSNLATMSELEQKEKDWPVTKLLISAWEKCVPEETRSKENIGTFCADLYGVLSNEIHGSSWSGPSVKNTFSKDQFVYECFISKICSFRRLELEK